MKPNVGTILIRKIESPMEIVDHILRNRATQSKVSRSMQFVATIGEHEAGYLSHEHRPELKCGIVYDLLVLPSYRNMGVGRQLMLTAEHLSVSLQCKYMRLYPKLFDGSISQDLLIRWYERQGYGPCNDGTHEMTKNLPS